MKKEIQDAIEVAERSEGYLIMVSYLHDGDKLEHSYFTRDYRRDDIMPSLSQHEQMLRKEAQPPKVELTKEVSGKVDGKDVQSEEKPAEVIVKTKKTEIKEEEPKKDIL